MSTTEVLVVIAGLFIGYWVVSKLFFSASNNDRKADRNQQSGPERETRQRSDNAAPAWHDTLNVSPNATADEIRRSYRTLMSQYHPDKVATLGDELRALAESKTKEITSAYRSAMRLRGLDA
jgi:DnaJ like chaperone protein